MVPLHSLPACLVIRSPCNAPSQISSHLGNRCQLMRETPQRYWYKVSIISSLHPPVWSWVWGTSTENGSILERQCDFSPVSSLGQDLCSPPGEHMIALAAAKKLKKRIRILHKHANKAIYTNGYINNALLPLDFTMHLSVEWCGHCFQLARMFTHRHNIVVCFFICPLGNI